ncbi:hypothetical protein KMT30_40790 [Streptomyces sp. IBSBF 2953]|uniref:hypothetical protein n=1 Tax=Streptomyces TaxID=1883 RepID=UPI00211A243C|nr:hypothetical protein [Streptomyces scabiei]MCQ9185262.1 hypothetical protein [Streptomyces hayashii]MDX3114676.1 hypothetical protein [Streptomyces scabiei]
MAATSGTGPASRSRLDPFKPVIANSTSPHLLISRNTATTTTAVGTFWLDKLVGPLSVGLDHRRQDRILEVAVASGADPIHLAHVFSLGAKTSLRYTTAVAVSAAECDVQR